MNLNVPKREWTGFAVALILVVGSFSFAIISSSQALGRLGEYKAHNDDLSTTVSQASRVVISADEADRIQKKIGALRDCFADAQKQGLIVSQLSEFARDRGLHVLEIQPTRPTGAAPAAYPLYRISVRGGFEQIAAYMDGFKSLRIPARAVGFGMWPATEGVAAARQALTADITVEAFIHQEPSKEVQNG